MRCEACNRRLVRRGGESRDTLVLMCPGCGWRTSGSGTATREQLEALQSVVTAAVCLNQPRARVLVADSSGATRKLLRSLLEPRGYHVETVEEGYWVHLFRYDAYGCGPHYTYALAYLVTREGEIVDTTSKARYRDPTEDGLCVD